MTLKSINSVLVLTALLSTNAVWASIPQELLNLFPRGKNVHSITGRTSAGNTCFVDLRADGNRFTAAVYEQDAKNADGQIVNPKKYAAFLLGTNYVLNSLESTKNSLTATNVTQVGIPLVAIARSTLKVSLNSRGAIDGFSISENKKELVIWSQKTVTCTF